jgi:hypothetical protein
VGVVELRVAFGREFRAQPQVDVGEDARGQVVEAFVAADHQRIAQHLLGDGEVGVKRGLHGGPAVLEVVVDELSRCQLMQVGVGDVGEPLHEQRPQEIDASPPDARADRR